MNTPNKKKLGYKQYASLLADAHQKLEILANKYHELQTFFIGYVEYSGNNIEFNDWMNKRLAELQAKAAKEEQAHEKV